ncbi:MAG: hypothetical protein IPG07_21875 [Crocinitomicaceae bacterium]|nr:hypothetical protein [Crocinitomicaceae bacterium]
MKEQVLYYVKLASISVLNWIAINLINLFTFLITFFVGIYMFSDEIQFSGGSGAHAGMVMVYLYLIQAFFERPMEFLMLTFIFFSPGFIYILSNKYVLSKIIHRLLKDKAENTLEPILDKVLVKFQPQETGILKKSTDYARVKLKLVQQLKSESENKIQKRVLTYGLKKAKLDDVDFTNPNINFNQIIKQKTIATLKEITKPSLSKIILILLLDWMFLIVIAITC